VIDMAKQLQQSGQTDQALAMLRQAQAENPEVLPAGSTMMHGSACPY